MLMERNRSSKMRRRRGAMLAELGPALLILFFFLFFPLVDLLGLGISYCSCLSLNDLQVREAAFESSELAQNATGAVKREIPANWVKSGLGQFVNLESSPLTTVSYRKAGTVENSEVYVKVTTETKVRPFLNIPFLPGIPGLSQGLTFVVGSERLVENPSGIQQI